MDGQVTNLSSRNKDYAHELVTARGIYILIRVERESLHILMYRMGHLPVILTLLH